MKPRLAMLWTVGLLLANPVRPAAHAEETGAAEAEVEVEEGREFHAHHLALFGGGTVNLEEDDTVGTIGLEYTHRLAWGEGRIGLGVSGEALLAEHTEGVVAFPLSFFALPAWSIHAGPGFELVSEEIGGEGEPEGGDGGEREVEALFLFRVGSAYSFELGRGFSLTPGIDVDVVRSNPSIVFGISLGKGF